MCHLVDMFNEKLIKGVNIFIHLFLILYGIPFAVYIILSIILNVPILYLFNDTELASVILLSGVFGATLAIEYFYINMRTFSLDP